MNGRRARQWVLAVICLILMAPLAGFRSHGAECPGEVKNQGKISDTQGGFTGVIEQFDFFGGSVSLLGDLDGDGVPELAVGAGGDDDGGAPPLADRGRGLGPFSQCQRDREIPSEDQRHAGQLQRRAEQW